MKSSASIWHLLHNVKSSVKILSIFVAFLENMNFNMAFFGNNSSHSFLEGPVLVR